MGTRQLDRDFLIAALDYESETGHFKWRHTTRTRTAGAIAGGPTDRGYWRIALGNGRYLAHRLAWLYVYGDLPEQIDHINGNRQDNRISNLRLAGNSANHANSKRYCTNTSGFKGVCWSSEKRKWMARITVNYRGHHLGYYEDPEQAHSAYLRAAREMHGEFARGA